jgi:hypothetical protein
MRAILKALAQRRPVLHSEADFQHALAWEIHTQPPEPDVRLEWPMRDGAKRAHVDIRVRLAGKTLLIEVKYLTAEFNNEVNGEQFNLLNHSAQDLGRYLFCADIARLERFVTLDSAASGCAILLTNDSYYWESTRSGRHRRDEDFRLVPGRVLEGELRWLPEPTQCAVQQKVDHPITLTGAYTLSWRDYYEHDKSPNGKFRYLLVEVSARRVR